MGELLPATSPSPSFFPSDAQALWPEHFPMKLEASMGIVKWIPESIYSQSTVVAWRVEDLRQFPIHKMARWKHWTLYAPSCHLHWEKWLGCRTIGQGDFSGWKWFFLECICCCCCTPAVLEELWCLRAALFQFHLKQTKKPHWSNFNEGFWTGFCTAETNSISFTLLNLFLKQCVTMCAHIH